MTTSHQPSFWIVAGADGVGKTTYAKAHIAEVSGSLEFINQDDIARGLYPSYFKMRSSYHGQLTIRNSEQLALASPLLQRAISELAD